MLKRALAGVSAALLLTTLSACGEEDSGADEASDTTSADPTTTAPGEGSGEAGACSYVEDGSGGAELPPGEPAYSDNVAVNFSTTIGDFSATLDAATAPCTVNSFASLAEQGYFDDTTCHRLTVTQGFEVLQCGDPTGTGTGGPGYTIPDEYDGSETYPAGTLAMANTGAPDSGGSQFFIVYGDTQLPPQYTVFGTVDAAGIKAITQAAKAGVEPQMGPEDGAPKTPIDLTTVSLG